MANKFKLFKSMNSSQKIGSKIEAEKIKQLYSMLLKMEKKRPNFSAKRIVKKLHPDYKF